MLLAHDEELVEGALLFVDKHRQVIEVEARLLTRRFIQVGLVEGGRCPVLLNAQVIERVRS